MENEDTSEHNSVLKSLLEENIKLVKDLHKMNNQISMLTQQVRLISFEVRGVRSEDDYDYDNHAGVIYFLRQINKGIQQIGGLIVMIAFFFIAKILFW